MKYNWRRWFRAFHRDIGYVAVALVLAYSLSGIAVNHIEDWNPNYTFDERAVAIGPLTGTLAEMEAQVIERLAIDRRIVRGHFQETPRLLRVFLEEGQEAAVDITTGRGTPYGLAAVPVIKVATRTDLARRWHDLMDVNAGRIADGEVSIEDVGWEMFRLMLDVASGRKKTWAEHWKLHNALVLFNPAPVT